MENADKLKNVSICSWVNIKQSKIHTYIHTLAACQPLKNESRD